MRNNSLTIKKTFFKILDELLEEHFKFEEIVYDKLKPKVDKFKLKRIEEYSKRDLIKIEDILDLDKDINSIHHLESKYNLHLNDEQMCELYRERESLVLDFFGLIEKRIIEPPLTEKEKKERLKEYKDIINFTHSQLNLK